MSEPRSRLFAEYREQEQLARVVAALLESNDEDTPLALAVGAEPTTVDLEIAGHVLDWLEDRGWRGPDQRVGS